MWQCQIYEAKCSIIFFFVFFESNFHVTTPDVNFLDYLHVHIHVPYNILPWIQSCTLYVEHIFQIFCFFHQKLHVLSCWHFLESNTFGIHTNSFHWLSIELTRKAVFILKPFVVKTCVMHCGICWHETEASPPGRCYWWNIAGVTGGVTGAISQRESNLQCQANSM